MTDLDSLKNLDEGSLIRESRGIYSFADSVNDEFVLLQSRCKKGILCSYPFLFDDRRVMKDLLAEP